MDTEILPYKQDDFDALIKLFLLNSPTYFATEELEDFKKYLHNEREDYYVVKVAGAIVGCGGINYDLQKKTGIISWDMIDPAFHAQGIGSKLLKYRLAILHDNSAIELIIVRTSQHTYRYYEKNGFYTQKVVENYWAPGFDLYLMHYRSNN